MNTVDRFSPRWGYLDCPVREQTPMKGSARQLQAATTQIGNDTVMFRFGSQPQPNPLAPLLEKITKQGDLDAQQQKTLAQYGQLEAFQQILLNRGYHEIPHTLDYFRLLENQLTQRYERRLYRLLEAPEGKKFSRSQQQMLADMALASQNADLTREKLQALSQAEQAAIVRQTVARFKQTATQTIMPQMIQEMAAAQRQMNQAAQDIRCVFNYQADKNLTPEQARWMEQLKPQGKPPRCTAEDVEAIDRLCHRFAKSPDDANTIFVHFFEHLAEARNTLETRSVDGVQTVASLQQQLPEDWYTEPWYYAYVQYFGTDANGQGTFKTLEQQLDYLDDIQIKNIYILPHYDSPEGDAGYDIRQYRPADKLSSDGHSGQQEWEHFLNKANARGFRVATDLVFNHTSVEHPWFQKALQGEAKYFDYYLKCPPEWENVDLQQAVKDVQGDLILHLPEKDASGDSVESKRVLIFPDISRSVWGSFHIPPLEKKVLFYREFYPFQIDLDLQNPQVVDELFDLIGQEVSQGVLGKRADAIAHWIKAPGTSGKGLPESHALLELMKYYMKLVSDKSIILPEVVTESLDLKTYAGQTATINGRETTSKGDALFDFQLQGMLREMLYFQKTTPFWTKVYGRGEEGVNTAAPLLPMEHHDETYMGFLDERRAMAHYLEGGYRSEAGPTAEVAKNAAPMVEKRGVVYKNGMSAGARYANALNENPQRIANAFFVQYMMPATPVIYYGTEIGATNRWDQMAERQQTQFQLLETQFRNLGMENPVTLAMCEDPRELQRGAIPQTAFQQAVENHYPAIETIRRLNALRSERSALRSYYLTDLRTQDAGVLGMVKHPASGARLADGRLEPPVVVLSNLTEQPKRVPLDVTQLREKLALEPTEAATLRPIYRTPANGRVPALPDSDVSLPKLPVTAPLMVILPPYSGLLLEALSEESTPAGS
ncbi:MAG: alpha-amylase family glycosyl hydrolase [Candidatus Melainabacteria bacterium]|nr:alpha-amylase family glycosyl hydrolase [Candidatus Melainabacteria bacterium]